MRIGVHVCMLLATAVASAADTVNIVVYELSSDQTRTIKYPTAPSIGQSGRAIARITVADSGERSIQKTVQLGHGFILEFRTSADEVSSCFYVVVKNSGDRLGFKHHAWCYDEEKGRYHYKDRFPPFSYARIEATTAAGYLDIHKIEIEDDTFLSYDNNMFLPPDTTDELLLKKGSVFQLDP